MAFKTHKLKEAAELRRAIDAGAELRDRRGRRVRPLRPAMIRKLADCLATILDEAVDDGHLERNPARSRRMRIKVPKPLRTFLEMDELVALTDAAGEQDSRFARPKLEDIPAPPRAEPSPGGFGLEVAERVGDGDGDALCLPDGRAGLVVAGCPEKRHGLRHRERQIERRDGRPADRACEAPTGDRIRRGQARSSASSVTSRPSKSSSRATVPTQVPATSGPAR